MHSRQAIVDKIMSWLGCHEGDSVHKHIIDTYNAHKPLARGYKVKYTDAWCATTVSAAAIECGYTDIIPTECSCNQMIKLLQQRGVWEENDAYVPKKGDIIFYDWQDSGAGDDKGTSEHVGIVVTEPDASGKFSVCEGNKSDGVNLRTMTVNGRYIRGFGVPKYDDIDNTIPLHPQSAGKPEKGPVYGLDVSACQSAVDFGKVKKAGYQFVILRATTKNGQPDQKFAQYYKNAVSAGVKVQGVYKLTYAMNPPAAFNEAVKVVQLLNSVKCTDCTIWLDLENDGGQNVLPKDQIEAIARGFLDYCEASGFTVGIYCNEDWYNNHISDYLKQKYTFWAARYGKNNGTCDPNYKPRFKNGYKIWQFTSHGKIDGVKGGENNYVDLDVMS